MSTSEFPDLEPEIADLLAAECERPGMPADAKKRVLERVGTTLGIGLGAGAAAGALGGGDAATAASGGIFGGKLALVLTAFALGGAVGAGGHAQIADAPQTLAAALPGHVVIELVAAAPPAEEATAHDDATPDDAPEASAPPATSASSASKSTRSGRDVGLAAERRLLEVARTALARGQADAALQALRSHRQRFPRGRLAEERESLTIQALSASGRQDEARARAKRFRKNSPNSILLPGVDKVLEQGKSD